MPRIESSITVDLDIEKAFALSQTYGKIRYAWDPFVKEQHLLNGATKAAKGVQTSTTSRHKMKMISEYITYNPPTHVGMKMISGPWFFKSFSGGWNFSQEEGKVKVVWRYNFVCKPKFLKSFFEFFGKKILQKDIDNRLAAFANACQNEQIIKLIS